MGGIGIGKTYFGLHFMNDPFFLVMAKMDMRPRVTCSRKTHNALIDENLIVYALQDISCGDELYVDYSYASDDCECVGCKNKNALLGP